jgi:hypothetical protein
MLIPSVDAVYFLPNAPWSLIPCIATSSGSINFIERHFVFESILYVKRCCWRCRDGCPKHGSSEVGGSRKVCGSREGPKSSGSGWSRSRGHIEFRAKDREEGSGQPDWFSAQPDYCDRAVALSGVGNCLHGLRDFGYIREARSECSSCTPRMGGIGIRDPVADNGSRVPGCGCRPGTPGMDPTAERSRQVVHPCKVSRRSR